MIFEIAKKIVNHNYQKVLKRLKAKEKINVVFLVSENQKWAYQSVFEELCKNNKINVKILISYPKDLKLNENEKEAFLHKNFEFYSKIDKNAEFIYKNNNYISLKKFRPDIVFYEQQWGLPRKYKPYMVSFYALTYFSCYGMQMFDFKEDYTKTFHYFLYRYLLDSKENFLRFKKYNKNFTKNCIVTGYPKLDYYLDKKEKNKNSKPVVIYAPHHSFDSRLNTSTFNQNGEFILSVATKTKDKINWIFKPHPRLKKSLIENNFYSKKQIDDYYQKWAKVGTVFDFGNYFDIFYFSDILITDCCSFLGEYYYTNNYLIRLVNKNAIELNDFGKTITKNYFCVFNNTEIEETLEKLLQIKNQNHKTNSKPKNKASKTIVNSIFKDFK